ncbi:unnamed protein product [Alopecurus aequalis]
MHGNRLAGLFLLFTALLAVSASAAVDVYSGPDVISHAPASATRASARLHTASTLVRRLEEEVTEELSWAASLLAGDHVAENAVNNKDKAACKGPCPAGAPYSYPGRGCQPVYQCR